MLFTVTDRHPNDIFTHVHNQDRDTTDTIFVYDGYSQRQYRTQSTSKRNKTTRFEEKNLANSTLTVLGPPSSIFRCAPKIHTHTHIDIHTQSNNYTHSII